MWYYKRPLHNNWNINRKTTLFDIFTLKYLLYTWIILCIIFFVNYAWNFLLQGWLQATNTLTKYSTKALWMTMKSDQRGMINVVLAGYAWEDAMGWLLTDSIMVVSYHPWRNAATFLSIPRDLYVSYGTGLWAWKINWFFWTHYLVATWSEQEKIEFAALALAKKVSDITGIQTSYYGLINFDWFVTLIDSIWGIEVEVPERLYDTQFPDDDYKWYITLDIPSGNQFMDGKTALKYARSRHSTSDFSRSARQQLIISAVINKLISSFSITNVSNYKHLFSQIISVITSNVDLEDTISLLPGLTKQRYMFHFWYSADCDTRSIESIQPGCLLYNADRNLFGGAATMLPEGATPSKISSYKATQNFWSRITSNQDIFIENAPITIVNNIDTAYAKQKNQITQGHALRLWLELKKKGFVIDDIQSLIEISTWTVLYVLDPHEYQSTIKALQSIIPIDTIITGSSAQYLDMTLVLWNTYIDYLSTKQSQ